MRRLSGRALTAAVLAAGAVALSTVADRVGVFERLELVLYDALLTRFRAHHPRSEDVAILAADDLTLQGISAKYRMRFARWPYSRNFWAVLVHYLHAAGARALIFDMAMDEPSQTAEDDDVFARTVSESELPTYLGFVTRPLSAQEEQAGVTAGPTVARNRLEVGRFQPLVVADDAFGVDRPGASPAEVAEALTFPVETHGLEPPLLFDAVAHKPSYPQPPIPQLIPVLPGFGLVLPEADIDGAMRRTHFAYRDARGDRYVTLSVSAAADLLGAQRLELEPGKLRLGHRALDISRDGSAEIDYGGELAERFEVCSLYFVFNQAVRLNDGLDTEPHEPDVCPLRDKILFVAGFAVGTYDVKATPFEPKAQGVIKPAAELDALLHGTFIRRAHRLADMGWALLVALLSTAVVLAARSAWVQLGWLPVGVAVSLLGSGVSLATGIHLAAALPLISVIVATAAAMGFNYLSADRERQRMQTMFSRYVSKLVVDQLASQPELPRLDGENREVTAFFSDIRKFSTFSEKFKDDPRTLVHLLNTYLTRVSGTLLKHGACLDKYIGDAVVCIFGAPLPQADHAVRACRAALEVQQEVARLRQEYAAKGLPDVYTRVGMNSAVMFVGNFGSEQLFNYTAMGDGMNLASRLEGANKAYETLIMIGPRTFELARDFIEARELDLARVAGKTEALAVYELMALKGGLSDVQGQARELYVRGLALYRAARFQEALEALEQALKLLPGDGPSKVLAMRCRKFSEHPPPHFDGVIDLDK